MRETLQSAFEQSVPDAQNYEWVYGSSEKTKGYLIANVTKVGAFMIGFSGTTMVIVPFHEEGDGVAVSQPIVLQPSDMKKFSYQPKKAPPKFLSSAKLQYKILKMKCDALKSITINVTPGGASRLQTMDSDLGTKVRVDQEDAFEKFCDFLPRFEDAVS